MKRRLGVGLGLAALLIAVLYLLNAAPRGQDGTRDARSAPTGTTEMLENVHAARSPAELTEAERTLAQAEALRPDASAIPYGRGLLLAKQGRHREAIAEFERALERDPNSTDALYNLALSLAFEGRAAESARVRARFERARDYQRQRIQLMLRVQREPARADLWRRALALAEEHNAADLAATARQHLQTLEAGPLPAPP